MKNRLAKVTFNMTNHAHHSPGNWLRKTLGTACALCIFASVAPAAADGNVISPSRLSPADRAALTTSIEAAKKVHPEAFDSVRALSARAAEYDASRRGRMTPMGPRFKALGANALFAMLDVVAVDAPKRGDMPDTAWIALRAGLIEAIGALRDSRARPVLNAILSGPEQEHYVVRATVEAIGMLGTDADTARLVAASKAGGPKALSIVSALGHCRRLGAAQELARVLRQHPADDMAKAAAKSLGDVGSAWAWKTPDVARYASEEKAIRALAARALVDAFVAYDDEVRQAASNALMVVDDASTPALIEAAKAQASPETVAALDALAARFARNPTR